MSSVKLSIIMPCYNCETTIQESIDSIYAQNVTFSFEIIMIDDGSTDGTYKLIKSLQDHHSEIHIFQNKTNMGECFSRNKAISYCKGSIIGYLDADNLLDKDCLPNMVSFI
ncbi:glycosyl transferase, partial [Candidatus Marinamargulisbacteria bacterium SCGC AG-343-D04]